MNSFDVIVVGGGHAGCEAAMAAANLGSKVLLISMDRLGFAKMSCNPAMGGIAKGQIVREIDALGGYSGSVTDRSTLQFRMLNKSKGPAMWSPRAQCDKLRFSLNWLNILLSNCNITIYEGLSSSFLIENSKICGVRTDDGIIFKSRAVILTAGTFLGGKLFVGRTQMIGGRIGERSSEGLAQQLASFGIPVDRMKTGTPPRIDINSVDLSKLTLQYGDENPGRFSYLDVESRIQGGSPQLQCYIVHTNEAVHDVLRSGFKDSPLFNGVIHGRGPRYCPSIEDKLRVFPDNNAHQLFLEPESEHSNEFYLQGFSSSLPYEIQLSALRKIVGFENVEVFRPAYAVEYDYFDPTALSSSLESRAVENLFLAGQVNGTTGYEEAAAQGIIAGINAHLKVHDSAPFILGRDSSYIGVLIDDLVTKGVDEPYRMFTSRAEYRVILRQDNADYRLTPLSHSIGLASDERYRLMMEKYEKIDKLGQFCDSVNLTSSQVNSYLESIGSKALTDSRRISDILSRPSVALSSLLPLVPRGTFDKYSIPSDFSEDVIESVEINVKYRGYIDRELQLAAKLKNLEDLKIPENFDFDKISGLTIECRQKFKKYAPKTIAQASRISGVSPADISVLLVYFGR